MGLTAPRVGIVGGTGGMGRWLKDLLIDRNMEVLISGRRTDLTPKEMTGLCDVVVLSVPISDTIDVIKEIGPLVHEQGLLMDLSSIKKGPLDAMLKYSRGMVVGLHPLFGPDSRDKTGNGIAICPGRGVDGLEWIACLFRDEGYRVTILDAEIHDRMMGIVQGLNHFSTLAFAMAVSDSGLFLEDLEALSTNTFHNRINRIKALLSQSPDLFRSLLMENSAAGEYIDQYLESVKKLIEIIGRGDGPAFEDLFESLKGYFKDNSGPDPVLLDMDVSG